MTYGSESEFATHYTTAPNVHSSSLFPVVSRDLLSFRLEVSVIMVVVVQVKYESAVFVS